MANDSSAKEAARAYLSDRFHEILAAGDGFEKAEADCVAAGNELMAAAMGEALERLDAELCSALPAGTRVHDRRRRTLATTVGDVSFRYRRCRDEAGGTVVPLADELDVPWGARLSPAARAFLVEAGASVSFLRAASLLARAGGSRVSAVTAMSALHEVGRLCAEEDEACADELFRDGVVPDAACEAEEVCLEADGTWFGLQHVPEGQPRKVEVKALVCYQGKGGGARARAVRHGCVATPEGFWRQGVAAVGTRFDLSGLRRCHLGADGEAMYLRGAEYMPCDVDAHLDPFHVNRAVLACFAPERRALARNVLGAAMDGRARDAADMLEACADAGLANARAARTAAYLRNNADIVYSGGPALGTMEAEQQHVYGCRMDSVPCAWSRPGADAMARVRSRICSGRALPAPTRESSATPRRRRADRRRELSWLERGGCGRVPESVGRGREPEHVASVVGMSAQVRYAAGVDSGMVAL